MARPRKYTEADIVAALQLKRGMVYLAAAVLDCEPDTIYNRAKTSKAIAAAMKNERGKFVDTAEMKLFDAVENGEPWAVRMALYTLGKDRGYYEKSEQVGSTEQFVKVVDLSDRTPGPVLQAAGGGEAAVGGPEPGTAGQRPGGDGEVPGVS